jgi:hypothetical protein
MGTDCEGLITSTLDGSLSAKHPKVEPDSINVAPATGHSSNTLRFAIRPAACWLLPDLAFDFGSSVVQPEASGHFKHLSVVRKANPGSPMSVFGHADPSGRDGFNKHLSGRRAMAVYGVLTRDTGLWEKIYKQPLGDDNWKSNGVDTMLAALGRDPATSDVKTNASSRASLFKDYMEFLCRDEDGQPFIFQKSDFRAQGANTRGKGDYQGCSEFNPVLMFSKQEDANFNADPDKTKRDEANAPNRRVIVFLWQAGTQVKPDKWPCPAAEEGISGCQKRFWSDASERRKFQEQRREFAKTLDTFACRFYQRIAEPSPCEKTIEQSTPTFFTIEQPGAPNSVRMHSLFAYVVHFAGDSTVLESVEKCFIKEGKLVKPSDQSPIAIHCNRQTWFYFSHRDDLDTLDKAKFFKRDASALPLLGPICVPCGANPEVNVDIWKQQDWAIVRGPRVDGVRPSNVKMAEWQETYNIGHLLPLQKGGMGFFPFGSFREKDRQEVWKGGLPIALAHLGNPNGNPMWAGTLSALPTPKAKLLLVHDSARVGPINVTSYNEMAPTGKNQDLPGHHQFDTNLVNRLLALPRDDQPTSAVDVFPNPPERVLLPGDMCWQDQGQTNNCGAFSFSTVMNYWMPYTNNPGGKDGTLYAKPGNVPDTINGARTPADIVTAAHRFRMNGRDNDAEELDRTRALKLVKLWLQAGVPVLLLVEEEYNVWSLHWKTVVGYDKDRFFMNNSGADDEVILAQRTPGIDYEHAPLGNDVDSHAAFFNKWKAAGGDVVDLITSVDECTFIPIFPQDSMFSGQAVK